MPKPEDYPTPESGVGSTEKVSVQSLINYLKSRQGMSADEVFEKEYSGHSEPTNYGLKASKLIDNFFGTPSTIYYPGSYYDLSFTKLYPEARVIHVDIESEPVEAMRRSGYEAYKADRDEFVPDDPADIVVIFNAGYAAEEHLKKVTKPGSLVIVNDWHHAATFMNESCPDFSLVGVVGNNNPEKIIEDFDTSKLGRMPGQDEGLDISPYSDIIFAFQRQK